MKKRYLFLLLFPFLFYENKSISISEHELYFKKLPKDFDNFKIVHLSDIHDTMFGKNQKRLIEKVKNLNPDIIFITGDIINRNTENFKKAFDLLDGLKNFNILYVTGNHEADNNRRNEFLQELKKRNVFVLDGKTLDIKKGDSKITVCGLRSLLKNKNSLYKEKLNEFEKISKDNFTILLSHRPDAFFEFVEKGMDLIFSGHAHGGQIRIPHTRFKNGVFAPNQGFMPMFTNGVYQKDGTKMVVSRGIGKSVCPLRIFNRPEIIKIVLRNE